MVLQAVKSTIIAKVGYDSTRMLLHIVFRTGMLCEYSNVEESVYKSMVSSRSIGNFYHAYIKGKYPYIKVGKIC